MGHERPTPPTRPSRGQEFGFTEKEELFDRVRHERLVEFLQDEATTVHRIEEGYNNYGEFQFVTVSRPGENRRILVCFWGQGYHEYRERWLSREWFWHYANAFPETEAQEVPRDEALDAVEQRRAYVAATATPDTQSQRGQLFEMLADLADDDGALAELEDLDWLAGDLE